MNGEPKTILSKPRKGWRAVLFALFLIILAPWLVAGLEVWLMGLRFEGQEWSMFAKVSVWLFGCELFLFGLAAAIRWLCCWRNFRRFLLGLASVATLIAVFYTEETWRGKWAWNRYVRAQAARGEVMEPLAFIPAPVPDDQNFCLCPLFKPLLDFKKVDQSSQGNAHGYSSIIWGDTNGMARVQALRPSLNQNGVAPRITNGLAGWQAYYRSLTNSSDLSLTNSPAQAAMLAFKRRYGQGMHSPPDPNLFDLSLTNSPAEDVLLVLSRFEPALAELKREAARRPLDRWPVQYDTDNFWEILLQHLSSLKSICSLLQLRASAYLASGDPASALSDLELGFRIADSVRTEPFLISHLVRNACYKELLQPLKEGLERHQFSDPQLVSLQRQLQSADLLAGYQLATRAEQALSIAWTKLTWDQVESLSELVSAKFARPFVAIALFNRVAPKGWAYQNVLSLSRTYDHYILPVVDLKTRTVRPERAKAIPNVANQAYGPYSLLTRLILTPGSFFGDSRFQHSQLAHVQTEVDEAFIACGLERYRLALGRYPDTLEALLPRFIDKLPHDVIGGLPLKYRRPTEDSFVLYSVGWDEKDSGGVPGATIEDGDWVWPQHKPE